MKYKDLTTKLSINPNRIIGIKNAVVLLNRLKEYGNKLNDYDVYYNAPSFNKYFEFKTVIVDHEKQIILFELGE